LAAAGFQPASRLSAGGRIAVSAVDDESRLEHESVRNHGIVLRVGVLLDVEVLLNRSGGVGEEGPLCANRRAELLERVMVVGRDRDNPRICHSDLRVKRGKLQMLLVFFRAIVAARKRQDEGIITLEFAEPAWGARMIGLLIVRGEQRAVFVYQIESYRSIPMAELASLQCVPRFRIRSQPTPSFLSTP
jgi:hypothetical protein